MDSDAQMVVTDIYFAGSFKKKNSPNVIRDFCQNVLNFGQVSLLGFSKEDIMDIPKRHSWDPDRLGLRSPDFPSRFSIESPDSRVRADKGPRNASWVII